MGAINCFPSKPGASLCYVGSHTSLSFSSSFLCVQLPTSVREAILYIHREYVTSVKSTSISVNKTLSYWLLCKPEENMTKETVGGVLGGWGGGAAIIIRRLDLWVFRPPVALTTATPLINPTKAHQISVNDRSNE